MPWFELFGGLTAGFIAGAINSIAGGGTMVSFPLLIFFGLPPLIANATNTVGIWPGAIGSVWGFRAELRELPRRYFWLLIPAALGGMYGAWLLRATPASDFERIVPWLLLGATILFFFQPLVRKRLERGARSGATNDSNLKFAFSMFLLLVVALYGGYFGAGMSILMLSILGVIGLTDMLQMTATTSLLSILINGTAGLVFVYFGLARWSVAVPMMVGSVVGGYLAAGWARRVGKVMVRRLVLTMALIMTISLFWRLL